MHVAAAGQPAAWAPSPIVSPPAATSTSDNRQPGRWLAIEIAANCVAGRPGSIVSLI